MRWIPYYEAHEWKEQEQGYPKAKKLDWEKPELVEICPLETKGIARCEDICTGGDNARYVCQKGCEHK